MMSRICGHLFGALAAINRRTAAPALFPLQGSVQRFDTQQEYVYQDEVYGLEGRPYNPLAQHQLPGDPSQGPSSSGGAAHQGGGVHYGPQWGLLTLTQPVTASEVTDSDAARMPASDCTIGACLHFANSDSNS